VKTTASVIQYSEIDSPLGCILLAGAEGIVRGLYFHDQKYLPQERGHWQRNDAAFPAIRQQLASYFAGEGTAFDGAVSPFGGTEFQRLVWASLKQIPLGQTCSYSQLATRMGCPAAVRAVAAAVGRNPVSLIVPCHRVIGAGGSLTGYAGGLERKRWLLEHEARILAGI
jgi:methylated-DNA-[protein]-cysteine S-methyltransferase